MTRRKKCLKEFSPRSLAIIKSYDREARDDGKKVLTVKGERKVKKKKKLKEL